MQEKSLTEFCFETLSKEVNLQRVSGLDDVAKVKLLSGEDGGGIRVYKGDEKIDKVTLVDLKYGDGIPIPHHDNALSTGSEIFQILPDLTYKLPIWGINSVVMKDGSYYFDTDFTFGFDLVTDYEFTIKYLNPFNEVYKKFWNHKDFKRVFDVGCRNDIDYYNIKNNCEYHLFEPNVEKYVMFPMAILQSPNDKDTMLFYSGKGDKKLIVRSAHIPWAHSSLNKQSNRISV